MMEISKDTQYHPIEWLKIVPSHYDPDKDGFYEGITEETAYALSDFFKSGKNIFNIEPELISLLDKTDIGDLYIEDINLPYEAFYLSFGDQAALHIPTFFEADEDELKEYEEDSDAIIYKGHVTHLNTDMYIQGVYISTTDDMLSLDLVPSPQRYVFGDFDDDYSYHFSFELNSKNKQKIIDEFESKFKSPYDYTGGELEYHRIKKIFVNSGMNKTYQEHIEQYSSRVEDVVWKETAMKALKLVINTLIHLSNEPDDLILDYPKFYPIKLVSKSKSDNKKESDRAKSKLNAQGYREVNFIGRKYKVYFKNEVSGLSQSTHWRRGHFRRQPFGSRDNMKHKIIWIKPTVINKSIAKDDELAGRIYNV